MWDRYLVVSAAVFSLGFFANPAQAREDVLIEAITVSGVGELNVNPDIAYVTFAIETLEKNAKDSQAKNAQTSAQVERILKDRFKLEKEDVKTVGYQVYAEYNYNNPRNQRELLGYKVINSLQVSFRALKDIGNLLDAVGGVGVNQVQGIQFDTEKRLDYEVEALRLAMENAKKKADTIAKSAGRPVKKVLRVDEAKNWSPPRPMPEYRAMKTMAMGMAADAAAPSTSISSGTLKIVTDVTVHYAL